MIIKTHSNFKKLGRVVNSMLASNPKAAAALEDATLEIGPANDRAYGIPASAVAHPLYVGDSAMLGELKGCTPAMEALFKKNEANIEMHPIYNTMTHKYDMVVKKSTFVGDSGEYLAGQAISPWNASYFSKIFKQPLLYSHARDMVKRDAGTNPWGEVMNLQTAAYSGWAQLGGAGTVAANLKKNINVQAGLMTAQIINIKVYFNYTTEEMQRATGGNGSPFAGQLMAEKPKYAQYVLDMITDYLTYYGNDETNTIGLFDVNGETTWAEDTLAEISADTSNTTQGSTMYKALASAVRKFMDDAYNKFDIVRVAMAPAAYNLLTSTPYSDNYEAKAPLAIFKENFEAGMTKDGGKVKIEFYSDPLLAANTVFNDDGLDRLVITAPEIGAGPNDDKQDLVLLGIPLENFAYPVYPNSYDQQHCVLRRFAGVFAPVSQAVKVYAGFGVAPSA